MNAFCFYQILLFGHKRFPREFDILLGCLRCLVGLGGGEDKELHADQEVRIAGVGVDLRSPNIGGYFSPGAPYFDSFVFLGDKNCRIPREELVGKLSLIYF